jgi:hypothetical protein
MVGLVILGVLALFGPLLPWARIHRAGLRLWQGLHRSDRGPDSRPLEAIAADARRLARDFHHQPRGQSFMKYEAHRRAYDEVLAEGCRALRVDHLLGVIEPGRELDAERARVEYRLECAGLELGLAL